MILGLRDRLRCRGRVCPRTALTTSLETVALGSVPVVPQQIWSRVQTRRNTTIGPRNTTPPMSRA